MTVSPEAAALRDAAGTPEARDRMTEWFESTSYVNEYRDGLPEVSDEEDDD